jgi:hypothetical protein
VAADWVKDPDAVLDWKWDWTNWMNANETISSSTFVADAGLTIDSSANGVTTTTVWLSGGNPGEPYRVSNKITTNQGRTDERSITIRVTNR